MSRQSLGWILALAALSVWLDLSQLHDLQTSDSLVPSLVSLQAWTPFFWQQDRYGMLMPLVFGGLSHPLYNQLAITWASICGGLVAMMATSHLFFGKDRSWPLIGLGAILWLVGAAPKAVVFDVLGPGQFFSTPMAMGLVAVWLLHTTRRPAVCSLALAVLALAAWVNCVAPVWVGLLVAMQRTSQPRAAARDGSRFAAIMRARPEDGWIWGGLFFAFGIGLGASRLAAAQDLRLVDVVGPKAAAHACVQMARHWYGLLAASPEWPGIGVGLFAMAAFGARRRGARTFARGGAGALVACSAYMLLVASERWVAQSGYHYRFGLPAAVVLMVALVGGGLGPYFVQRSGLWHAGVGVTLWCAVGAAVLARFGIPSVSGVRQSYQNLGGDWSREANELQCTHLAGSYWRVWPAVFAAELARSEGRAAPRLLGLTDRAEATVHLWPEHFQQWRICVPFGDKAALGYVAGIAGVRFVPAERGAQLGVLVGAEPELMR